MELTQSNKRPRATNSNFENNLDLTSNETQFLLSALHSIQEALAIVEDNKIIHANAAFQKLFNVQKHQQLDLASLKTSQHGTSENLLQNIQRTKHSGIKRTGLTILVEGQSKGICSIYALSSIRTLLLICPETKENRKNVDWNQFVEEANDVISLGIEYLPISPPTNLYDGRVMFATRSFSDLIGLIDDPTGKLLIHELGLGFKTDEWFQLAQTSVSASERKQNFAVCTLKSLDGKFKHLQCWSRFVGLSEQNMPLLFINIKETLETVNLSNSQVLLPLSATDLAMLSNPNTWKRFFDQSSIAMGIVELVNNDTDVRLVITNPLGNVGIKPFLSEQIPADQLKRTLEHYKQARLFARPVEIEQVYYMIQADQTFYTLISFVHIQSSYFMYMSQDITPLKILREKEQSYIQRIDQLQEKLASTSLVMSEMSSIMSQMEQMLQQCTDPIPSPPTWLQAADACCHHLSTIIHSQAAHTISSEHDLTALDPPTSLVPSKVSVLDTMQQAKSILSLEMQKKDIQMSIDCPSQACFMGFPDALRRLIVNLLFTMTKLSSPKNNLSVKAHRDSNNNSGMLEITITNTDLSQSAKETLQVMERLTQSSNTNNTTLSKGNSADTHQTAIAICQKLLKALDAKLRYDVLSEDLTNTLQLCLSIPVQCN